MRVTWWLAINFRVGIYSEVHNKHWKLCNFLDKLYTFGKILLAAQLNWTRLGLGKCNVHESRCNAIGKAIQMNNKLKKEIPHNITIVRTARNHP